MRKWQSWRKGIKARSASLTWDTLEGIRSAAFIYVRRLDGLAHLGTRAGGCALTRRGQATIVCGRPWTDHGNCGGFHGRGSTPFTARRWQTAAGTCSVAFDSATHRAYDVINPA